MRANSFLGVHHQWTWGLCHCQCWFDVTFPLAAYHFASKQGRATLNPKGFRVTRRPWLHSGARTLFPSQSNESPNKVRHRKMLKFD